MVEHNLFVADVDLALHNLVIRDNEVGDSAYPRYLDRFWHFHSVYTISGIILAKNMAIRMGTALLSSSSTCYFLPFDQPSRVVHTDFLGNILVQLVIQAHRTLINYGALSIKYTATIGCYFDETMFDALFLKSFLSPFNFEHPDILKARVRTLSSLEEEGSSFICEIGCSYTANQKQFTRKLAIISTELKPSGFPAWMQQYISRVNDDPRVEKLVTSSTSPFERKFVEILNSSQHIVFNYVAFSETRCKEFIRAAAVSAGISSNFKELSATEETAISLDYLRQQLGDIEQENSEEVAESRSEAFQELVERINLLLQREDARKERQWADLIERREKMKSTEEEMNDVDWVIEEAQNNHMSDVQVVKTLPKNAGPIDKRIALNQVVLSRLKAELAKERQIRTGDVCSSAVMPSSLLNKERNSSLIKAKQTEHRCKALPRLIFDEYKEGSSNRAVYATRKTALEISNKQGLEGLFDAFKAQEATLGGRPCAVTTVSGYCGVSIDGRLILLEERLWESLKD